MEYKLLRKLFWQMTAELVKMYVADPNKFIRLEYPTEGQPDWKIEDTIVFLNLVERDDSYGQQFESQDITETNTVIRHRYRTRVWDVVFTAYGPNAYELVNTLKDGVFIESSRTLLSKNNVFLVPDLPVCRQSPELFAGKWWNRWNIILCFNELYEAQPEDVGHIDTVQIHGNANR